MSGSTFSSVGAYSGSRTQSRSRVRTPRANDAEHDQVSSAGLSAGLQKRRRMTEITKEAMEGAAARHLSAGFNFRAYTPHKIAYDLIRWDEEFRHANYTRLVVAVTLWQSGSSD